MVFIDEGGMLHSAEYWTKDGLVRDLCRSTQVCTRRLIEKSKVIYDFFVATLSTESNLTQGKPELIGLDECII